MAIFSKLLSIQRSFSGCTRRFSLVNRSVTDGYLYSPTRRNQLQHIDRVLASSANHLHQDHVHLDKSGQGQLLKGQRRHEDSSISEHQQNVQRSRDFIVRSPYPDIEIPDNVSLPHLMINSLPKYGNATALVDGTTGQEMTFSQLHTSVVKVASAFVKLGLGRGDVVTLFSPNCPQFTIATLALGAVGAIFSPVNPTYTTGELKDALSHAHSKVLITIPALLPLAQPAVQQCPHVKEIIVFGEADNCRPFSSLLADDMTKFPENLDFQPKEDISALPFSSGTTGLPKAVMLSHYNLVANIIQNREKVAMGYRAGKDTLLAVLPFFHIYGQMLVMFAGLFCGAKIVTLPNFQPASFLESIQKYKPTYLHIVPPLLLFMAKHPLVAKYDLSSVENVFVGAAPASVSAIHELLDKFKNQFVVRQGYGLTEASPLTHCNGPEGNKYHTIGPCVNNTQFKVVDLETRESVGPGESGELCIRGPQVMLGYYQNKKASAETLVDGWLSTGDVGHYDEDGHVIIDDRIKELIKVKGLQVAPAELEAILVSHPSVLDAAVIGLKDERLGEAPKAFVVIQPQAKVTAEELKQFLAERVAPHKKLAGGIEFRSEIPKSASGKILRRLLKEEINPK